MLFLHECPVLCSCAYGGHMIEFICLRLDCIWVNPTRWFAVWRSESTWSGLIISYLLLVSVPKRIICKHLYFILNLLIFLCMEISQKLYPSFLFTVRHAPFIILLCVFICFWLARTTVGFPYCCALNSDCFEAAFSAPSFGHLLVFSSFRSFSQRYL